MDKNSGYLYLSNEGRKLAKREKKRQLKAIPQPKDFKKMTEDDDNEEEAQKERIQAAKMAVEKRAKKEKLDKMKAKRLARKDDTSFASMEDDEDYVEDDVDEDDDNDDDDDDGESFKGVQRQQEELVDDDSFISFDRRAVESVKSTSAYVVPEYIRRADRGGVISFSSMPPIDILVPRDLELSSCSIEIDVWDVGNNELLGTADLRGSTLVGFIEGGGARGGGFLPGFNGEWLPVVDPFTGSYSKSWNLSGDYIDLRILARGEDPTMAEIREYKFYELAILSLAGLPESRVQPDFFVAEQQAKESERKKQVEEERAFGKNPDAKEKFVAEDSKGAESMESDKEEERQKAYVMQCCGVYVRVMINGLLVGVSPLLQDPAVNAKAKSDGAPYAEDEFARLGPPVIVGSVGAGDERYLTHTSHGLKFPNEFGFQFLLKVPQEIPITDAVMQVEVVSRQGSGLLPTAAEISECVEAATKSGIPGVARLAQLGIEKRHWVDEVFARLTITDMDLLKLLRDYEREGGGDLGFTASQDMSYALDNEQQQEDDVEVDQVVDDTPIWEREDKAFKALLGKWVPVDYKGCYTKRYNLDSAIRTKKYADEDDDDDKDEHATARLGEARSLPRCQKSRCA